MEVALPGPLALDCEDMFKEITKKLYGEEGALDFPERGSDHDDGSSLKPEDHITAFGLAALMQNGFPPPGILHANFQPKTNPAAEDKWTATEESLQWTSSRIASYNPAQKLFKCVDCECVGFLSRVAEHWLGTHSNARVFQCPQCAYGSAWARCVRIHLVREHSMPDDRGTDSLVKNNPVLDEVTKYLQRLKVKVDGSSPQPAPAAIGRAPAASPPAVAPASVAGAAKRYGCPACPYATDRRDLFTRHENIHRDEKPFECYVCQKQFNRADHVKKHFLRMHRDHPYDLNRIRRQIPKSSPGNYYPKPAPDPMVQSNAPGPADQNYSARPTHPKNDHNIHQIKSEHDGNSMAKNNGAKKKGEKRYSCCYCPWSGVDNWCLKRHLNTHLKPFVCALCDYKAARSERLSTHVSKVHNKKACGKCSFLAEDQAQLNIHLQEQHHVENRNIKVPNTMLRAGYSGAPSTPLMPTFGSPGDGNGGGGGGGLGSVRQWRPPRQQGAARLFNYMEASDGSDQDEYQDGKAFPPVTERSVQDFPEAGDAGSATAASPARAPEPKKRSPKKKRSHDKENKKSIFSCNICSTSFKTAGLLSEHSRRHSPICPSSSLRSPLLVSNSTSPLFAFDELDDSGGAAWDSDENGRHSKRSRKQSRPKKVVQVESQPLTGNLSPVIEKISRFEDVSSSTEITLPRTKVSLAPSNNLKPIDQIVSNLVKHKENRLPALNVKINKKPSVKRKISLSAYGKLQKLIQAFEKSHLSKETDERSALSRARSIASTFFLDSLRNKKPNVVYKCKLCRLKFKRRFEISIHYQYCKNKNIKPNK